MSVCSCPVRAESRGEARVARAELLAGAGPPVVWLAPLLTLVRAGVAPESTRKAGAFRAVAERCLGVAFPLEGSRRVARRRVGLLPVGLQQAVPPQVV